MSKLTTLTPIAAVLAVAVAGFSHAADAPFVAKPVAATAPADAGKEGKCGSIKEAKCGAGMKEEGMTMKEGKCGGAMKEGKCGAAKAAAEGKAKKEGKCGEGKCGAKKKAAEAAAAKEAADKK